MKYETSQVFVHMGVALLILAAIFGMYLWHQTTQRVDQLEAKQIKAGCPVCPSKVDCILTMPPIKGELLFKEKK